MNNLTDDVSEIEIAAAVVSERIEAGIARMDESQKIDAEVWLIEFEDHDAKP